MREICREKKISLRSKEYGYECDSVKKEEKIEAPACAAVAAYNDTI